VLRVDWSSARIERAIDSGVGADVEADGPVSRCAAAGDAGELGEQPVAARARTKHS
jgi:hypothetical protein